MAIKIFCCYAHEDEALLNKLRAQLRPLEREGLIELWHDRDISAGTEWEREIDTCLNTAGIILLLVSPDFMNSDYCYSIEMKRALEGHERGKACVIPIILRPIDLKGAPFEKLQVLPTNAKAITSWRNRDKAFLDVEEGIRKDIQQMTPQSEEPVPLAEAKEHEQPALKPKPSSDMAIFKGGLFTGSPILYIGLVLLIIAILVGSVGLLRQTHSILPRQTHSLTPSPLVGYLHFLSSGQTSETSNQGVADEVRLDLRSFHVPPADKSDYAWLLPDADQPENHPVLLGKITGNGTTGSLTYNGAQHSNLLAVTSRFLITEESATIIPLAPSTDHSTWRYIGQIPQIVPPREQYSYLDHLRHLLTDDPKLHAIHLSGGLATWFSRSMQAIYRWTLGARDDWQASTSPNPVTMRQETVRILDYLDGIPYVWRDLPATISSPVLLDDHIGRIGILESVPQQDPPGYIDHIILHLNGLVSSPGADPALQGHIAQVITAMNTVNMWLEHVRQDAKQLLAMTDQQLQQQALAILNDMVMTANFALNGKTDPVTGTTQEGVEWITQAIGSLAIIPITVYTG